MAQDSNLYAIVISLVLLGLTFRYLFSSSTPPQPISGGRPVNEQEVLRKAFLSALDADD